MLFKFFTQLKKPILLQIDNYHEWKSLRYPIAAKGHKTILRELFSFTRVRFVSEITQEQIQTFVDRQQSGYFKKYYAQAIKSFFMYCRMMGYVETLLAPVNTEGTIAPMITTGPLVHIEQVQRVRMLRKKGLTLRQIQHRMETEDNKRYHLKQVHRWSQYKLSTAKA